MPAKKKKPHKKAINKRSAAIIGDEAEPWKMIDAFRAPIDRGEYKPGVLAALFLSGIPQFATAGR